ncbi:hypothetical protein N824_11575 [Pedobacter sp. V48]|nr:hypothetical protein N824_11575 [Pedobacter sp. V48]
MTIATKRVAAKQKSLVKYEQALKTILLQT